MGEEFLIIDKSILPEHFGMIIEIKELINNGYKISDACKKVGLSRSTFYKYKDYVFLTNGLNSKKANILVKMKEKGSLIELLTLLEELNIKVLNIHKETLVNGIQEVFLTLSTNNIIMDYNDVIKDVRRIKDIKEVLLLGSE
jgi:chorismate mutase